MSEHGHDSYTDSKYQKRCYCEKCKKKYDDWKKEHEEKGKTVCKKRCFTVCEIECTKKVEREINWGYKKKYEGKWEPHKEKSSSSSSSEHEEKKRRRRAARVAVTIKIANFDFLNNDFLTLLKLEMYPPVEQRVCTRHNCGHSVREHIIISLLECPTCASNLFKAMVILVNDPPILYTNTETKCFNYIKGLVNMTRFSNLYNRDYHLTALRVLIAARAIPDYQSYEIEIADRNLPFDGKLYYVGKC